MQDVKTRYGTLKGASVANVYNSGEVEDYIVEEESNLKISDYNFIPLYGFVDTRRKELPSVKFYKDESIRSLSLNEATQINTSIGSFEVEKLTFYKSGEINRLFLLDGKLSGYWSEEDEYTLAKEHEFNFIFGQFKAKVMSIHFYQSGEVQSITLWPKERAEITFKNIKLNVRIGVSLYKDGSLATCEPLRPTPIDTPIGKIEAFDRNAIGIHGEDNSLKFYQDGAIKSLITSTDVIEVYKDGGLVYTHSPKNVRHYSNSEELDLETVTIEFLNNTVVIDNNSKYNFNEYEFRIKSFGEKKLTLIGDLNN